MLPLPGQQAAGRRSAAQPTQRMRAPGAPPRRPQPPRSAPRRKRPWYGRAAMALLLVFVLLIVGIWIYLETSINRIDAIEEYDAQPAAAEGTNWLIVGSDSRQDLTAAQRRRLHTGSPTSKLTDTILLAHLPDNDTKPTLVSFPRDLNVEMPGIGWSKINSAYSRGGPELLVKTVEKATALRIDHYAEIGLGGFAEIVDAIGGVTIDVPEGMIDQSNGVELPAGEQELDGAQALSFVRMRKSAATPRSDLDRVVNQRKFIGALANEVASPATLLNPFDVVPLLGAIPKALSIGSDDHLHNVFGLAWAMRGISSGGTVTTTVPVSSGAATSFDPAKAQIMFDALRKDKPLPDSVINN